MTNEELEEKYCGKYASVQTPKEGVRYGIVQSIGNERDHVVVIVGNYRAVVDDLDDIEILSHGNT